MTERKIYIGSVGPFLYDDTDLIDDVDGDFPGETFKGLITDGPIQTTQVPSADEDVVRLADLTATHLLLINSIVCHDGAVIVHNGNVVTN